MVRPVIGVVIALFVTARALRAAALHKSVARAINQDPKLQFALVEEGVLLHSSEVEDLKHLNGEARIKLLTTAMRRQNLYMKKADVT